MLLSASGMKEARHALLVLEDRGKCLSHMAILKSWHILIKGGEGKSYLVQLEVFRHSTFQSYSLGKTLAEKAFGWASQKTNPTENKSTGTIWRTVTSGSRNPCDRTLPDNKQCSDFIRLCKPMNPRCQATSEPGSHLCWNSLSVPIFWFHTSMVKQLQLSWRDRQVMWQRLCEAVTQSVALG